MRHNVGMLVMRKTYATHGSLCQPCLGRTFRKHQLSNLFLGWWGTISFFMTFVFLIDNTVVYFGARKSLTQLQSRKEPQRLAPVGTASERLAPFRHNVRLRLQRGEPVSAIVADLAATHEASLSDAEAFVRELQNEAIAAPSAV